MSSSSANGREPALAPQDHIDAELALWKQLLFDTDMAPQDKQPAPDNDPNVGPFSTCQTCLTSLPASVFPACSATTPSGDIHLPHPGAPLPAGFGVPSIPSDLPTHLPAPNPPKLQSPLAAQHLRSSSLAVLLYKPTSRGCTTKHRLYPACPFSCGVHDGRAR